MTCHLSPHFSIKGTLHSKSTLGLLAGLKVQVYIFVTYLSDSYKLRVCKITTKAAVLKSVWWWWEICGITLEIWNQWLYHRNDNTV